MTRRSVLLLLPVTASMAAESAEGLRGQLRQNSEGKPALRTTAGVETLVDGDDQTRGVLRDARVRGMDFEVIGAMGTNGVFQIRPIHERAMYVHKGGKRLFVTYWCDVCSIRTYTPGVCWCCQEETELDLREQYS